MPLSGTGPPLVLVPGVQGRWEWLRPAMRALEPSFRVATFSLCGEPGAPAAGDDFDAHLAQVDGAVDALGGRPAVIMGISFGGWVALRYAALRPGRVRALVLVSTPGPGFTPHEQHAKWIDAPRRSFPAFVLTSPARLLPEVRAALPERGAALRFFTGHAWRALVAPMSPARAAARIRQALRIDFAAVARGVTAPTLIVTGEDGLDRVVPPESSRAFAGLIADARLARLERTGHIGCLTRPARLAEMLASFVGSLEHEHPDVA